MSQKDRNRGTIFGLDLVEKMDTFYVLVNSETLSCYGTFQGFYKQFLNYMEQKIQTENFPDQNG